MFARIAVIVFIALMLVAPIFAPRAAEQGSNGDMMRRTELSKEMHAIKPVKEQITAVINSIAEGVPEDKRAEFKQRMADEFDFKKLEETSVSAMAEVFTVAELERMIAYFGSAEAATIEEKMPIFQQLIQPEITRLVDKAMMTVRTGKPADEKTEKTDEE